MPDYAVSTAFTANDRKVINSFDRMRRRADKFGNKASAAFNKASRSGSRFGDVMKGVLAAGAVQRGIGALTSGMRAVTAQFVDFDDAVFGAGARFKDIGPDAADFKTRLDEIRASARDAGASTKFTAAQAAQGLDFLARAGFSSSEAMGSLVSMINLATSTGEDFATSADYSSDLLGAFGLQADTTAQKIASLNRLNDVLVKTANSANVTLEDMFETMKTAGPISKITGASLEKVAALTAILGNSGIKGTEAATALKNAMLRLSDDKIQKMLEANNVAIKDSHGNFRDFTDILSDLSGQLKGLGSVQQAKILNEVFGLRAIAGSKTLLENLSGLRDFETMLDKASGTSERTAKVLQQSLGNRLLSLGSAASEFGFKIIDAFEKKGRGGIVRLTEAIRNFDTKPLVDGLKAAFEWTGMLFRVIKPFLPFMPQLIGLFLVYNTTIKALAIGQSILSFFAFAKGIFATSGAMGILNAVMAANPIGAIALAITGLIALFVYLEKRFGIVSKGFELLKSGFIAAVGGMKKVFMKFASFYINIWAKIIQTVLTGASKIGGLIGIDTSGLDALSARIEKFRADVEASASGNQQAPNEKEARARQIQFRGRLDISGAPEGSTMSQKTIGAPPLHMEMMGRNH